MQSTGINWRPASKLITGMLHGSPLPGRRRCVESLDSVTAHVLRGDECLLEESLGAPRSIRHATVTPL